MRFAHVTTFYPPYNFGGDGIVVQRLATALSRRGHDVTVFHDTDTYEMLGGLVGAEPGRDSHGVHVVPVRGRPRLASALFTHQLGRPILKRPDLRTALDEGCFDVVHFHNVSMIGGPGVLSYGGDAVRLYTAHEHWLVCPTHVLWKNQREPCNERACLRCTLSYGRPPQLYRYSAYMEKQLCRVDVFFAQSEFSRRKHREMGFSFPMDVLSPFLPLVDEPSRSETTEAESVRSPFVLFAGRLERMKGLDDIVARWGDDCRAELVIAGAGPHSARLRALAAGSSRVRFLGRISNDMVTGLMARATAVLIPTVGYETFGFTAVEAFRASTPVVVRRCGPLPELTEQAGGGVIFDTAEQAVEAVHALLDEPDLAVRLGRSGRRAFETTWSEQVVVPRYLAKVQRVLSDRAAERSRS